MQKRNRKGFTLIEILVSIGIIMLLTATGFVTFNKITDQAKEKEYNKLAAEFESAAEVWLTKQKYYKIKLNETENEESSDESTIEETSDNLEENLYNGVVLQYQVTLDDLYNFNLIESEIVNPKTNKPFDYKSTYVKVYYDDLVEKESNKNKQKGLITEFMGKMAPTLKVKEPTKEYSIAEFANIGEKEWKENIDIIDPISSDDRDKMNCTLSNQQQTNKNNNKIYEVFCSVDFVLNDQGDSAFKTASFYVKPKSSLDATYEYTGKTITKTVDIDATYTFKAKGSQGASNGGEGAYLYSEVNLQKGDVIQIQVGGQATVFGGGIDGNNSTARAGGDSTRVWIKKNGESAFKLMMAAAGGGGGQSQFSANPDSLNLTTKEIKQSSGSGAGGEGEDNHGITPSTAKNGTNGTYASGGGAGNLFYECLSGGEQYTYYKKVCVPGYVKTSCHTRNRCSKCSCAKYYYCSSRSCGKCAKRNSCRNGKKCGYNTKRVCTRCVRAGGVAPSCSFPRNNTCAKYKKTRTAKSCRNSSCSCAKWPSCRTSACGCKTRNRCSKCSCAKWNTKYSTCASKKKVAKTGYKNCKKQVDVAEYFSGEGGQSIINADESLGVNELFTSIATTGGLGSLKIESELDPFIDDPEEETLEEETLESGEE